MAIAATPAQDVVLRDGTLPLDLLQEQVEHYIAAAH